MADGENQTLIRIAVFGITVSIIATALIAVLIAPNNEYTYDDIAAYRNELVSFSGNTMINDTPWVLTDVFTPWIPSQGVQGHMDADGWLYGTRVNYDQIGKAADIRLDPGQKSSVLLTIGESEHYRYASGREWWAGNNPMGWDVSGVKNIFGINISQDIFHLDPNTYSEGDASRWNFTGYRYQFTPTLPFSTETSTKDGSLSLVWYSFDGQEGLSGGLDVYGGDVLLASYAATDIIAAYESVGGYAAVYDFNFGGTHLNLSVKFDPDKTNAGYSLWECWTLGFWSLAISSVSAGNFYDIENSNAFVNTAGSLIDTFTSIFTFSMPSIDNPWMDLILWLLVALPMTIALLCITLRFVQSIKIL